MPDLISKCSMIEDLYSRFYDCSAKQAELVVQVIKAIKEHPCADAVTVTRCEWCHYWNKNEQYPTVGFCAIWERKRGSKEFCSEGRLKDD